MGWESIEEKFSIQLQRELWLWYKYIYIDCILVFQEVRLAVRLYTGILFREVGDLHYLV